MKFKYSAFTENTPEMREWLEKLGYEEGYHYDEFNKYIYTYQAINDKWYFCSCRINDFSAYNINCLGNPQLFQAVTAMRNDSDYMQWFVSDGLCRWGGSGSGFYHWYKCASERALSGYHKATLEELIAHFKVEH